MPFPSPTELQNRDSTGSEGCKETLCAFGGKGGAGRLIHSCSWVLGPDVIEHR